MHPAAVIPGEKILQQTDTFRSLLSAREQQEDYTLYPSSHTQTHTLDRENLRAVSVFSLFGRLLRLLQAQHPPQQGVHVQGPGGPQGPLPHRQDPPQPVQGLQTQKVLRRTHEQGW